MLVPEEGTWERPDAKEIRASFAFGEGLQGLVLNSENTADALH